MGNLHLVTYCISFVIVDSHISIIVRFDTPERHTHIDIRTPHQPYDVNGDKFSTFFLLPFRFSVVGFIFYYVTSFEEFRWHLFIFDALLYSMHDSSIDIVPTLYSKEDKNQHWENSATNQTQYFYYSFYSRGRVRWRCKSLKEQMPSSNRWSERRKKTIKKGNSNCKVV